MMHMLCYSSYVVLCVTGFMQMPFIGSRAPDSCLLQGDILVKGIPNIWDKALGT